MRSRLLVGVMLVTLAFGLAFTASVVAQPPVARSRGTNLLLLLLGLPHLMRRDHIATRGHVPIPQRRPRR